VHPSLLPLYRGPAPINWALRKGDKKTGVTIFKMDEGLDTGDIILQKTVPVSDNDNASTLREKLAEEGARLLIEALNMLKKGEWVTAPQNKTDSLFAAKFSKEDGRIDWNDSAVNIYNKIRAMFGWPSAYTFHGGKMIKILDAEIFLSAAENKPSTIETIKKDGIYVATGNGILKIKSLKPEGKRQMDAYSFVQGHRLKSGDTFEV
jgi:methionyl-tRNA formyltransferase